MEYEPPFARPPHEEYNHQVLTERTPPEARLMITKKQISSQQLTAKTDAVPRLAIAKIGIVSRDYTLKYSNGFRDFSAALPGALALLDKEGCDTVPFSLFSIVPRRSFRTFRSIQLHNIKSILYEEFTDGTKRKAGRYVVLHRKANTWHQYVLHQKFGSLTDVKKKTILEFVRDEIPQRILGNGCVLLCGETNGVKYSPKHKSVQDDFGLRQSLPREVTVILNPIHDRMTRFEMKLKRRFLSENDRWVVSVWNKGKQDKNGRVRDGNGPAWTIFRNGKQKEIVVEPIPNQTGLEIGVLEI